MAFQIDERMMAPDRAIITLNKSRKDLDLTDRLKFKPGMLHYIIDEGRLLLSVTPFTDKDGQMKYFKDLPIDSNISEILDKVGDIKEVEIEVEKLNEKYTQIMNEINENSKGVASNKKGVENNAQDIKSNTQSIKSNTQDIANNIQSIKSNTEDIKNNLENIKDNTDSIKSNAESIRSNVKNIENNAEKIQVIDSELKEIGDKIDNIGNNSNSSNIINRVEVIDFANYKDVNFNDAITIENTLQAPIEKLIIKGRTIKNIIKTKTSSINMAVKDESTDLGYHTGTLELSEKISPNKTYTFYANVSNSDNGSIHAFQNIVLGKSDGDDWSYRLDNNEDKVKNGVFIKNFTTPANFKATIDLYMKIICPNSNVLKDTVLDNIMLLEGTYSSEELNNRYIPNGLNSVGSNGIITIKKNDENISFKLPFADGLKKIDDAQDELNFDLNQIIQRIESTKLTGKEDWYFQAEEDGLLRFASDINIANTVNTVCDKFKEINITQKEEGYCFVGKAIHIKIASSKLHAHNVNDFKEYLKSNVVTLFSKLTQPRIYSIGSLKQFNDSKIIAEGSNGDSVTPMYNTREVILPFAGGLKSLGNIKDEIVTAKGEIVKNLDQIIITGKEKWQKDTSLSNNKYTVFVLSSIENKKANSNISCNTLKVSEKMLTSDNGYSFIVGGEGLSIKFLNLDLLSSDINGLIEWFKDNPTRVIYELKSPITYKINDLQFKNIKSDCENGNDKENNIIVKKDFETSVELPFKKELNGVRGTTYEIDYLNNKLSQKIEKAHLKEIAANRIVKENTLKNVTRFYIDTVCTNNLKGSKNVLSSDLCCNMIDYSTDEEGMCWDENVVGRLWIHTPKDKFSDVTELYNCIQEKDIVIYYELNEAIETYINLDDSLETFNDTTYVSIEDDIKGEIDLKANCKDGIKSFSGEGNCIINNSCEGNVEDLVIKGKTLKNMIDSKDINKIYGTSGYTTMDKEIVGNGVKYTTTKDKRQSYITIRSYQNKCIKPNTTYSFIFTIDKNEFKDYNGITVSGTDDSYFLREKNRLYSNENFDLSKGIKTISFTTPNDISEYDGLGFGLPQVGSQQEGQEFIIKDLMLIEGDFSNKVVPSYFEGIKSMGEIDCSNVIGIRNKNLFDFTKIIMKDTTIRLPGKSSYTLSSNKSVKYSLLGFKDGKHIKNIILSSVNNCSFSGEQYDSILFRVEPEDISKLITANFQLEKGTVATSYEPHVKKTNEMVTRSYGKNLFNPKDVVNFNVNGDKIEITSKKRGQALIEKDFLNPPYRLTAKVEGVDTSTNGSPGSFYQVFFTDGTFQHIALINVPKGADKATLITKPFDRIVMTNYPQVDCTIQVQLEKGTVATPYEPYKENIVVKYTGKNINSAKLEKGDILNFNGTCANSGYIIRSNDYVRVKPSTTYSAEYIPTKRGWDSIYFYDENKKYISFTQFRGIRTTPSNCYYIKYKMQFIENLNVNVQIEEGTISTPYEPYKEFSSDSVLPNGESETSKIIVKSSGKNLLDFKKVLSINGISSENINENEYTFTIKDSLFKQGIYCVKTEKQLTISCKIKSIDTSNFRIDIVYTDGTFDSSICVNSSDFICVKLTSNINKIVDKIRFNWSLIGKITIKDFQIEQGAIATPHEPFKEFTTVKYIGKNLLDYKTIKSENDSTISMIDNGVKIKRTQPHTSGDIFIGSYTIDKLKPYTDYKLSLTPTYNKNEAKCTIYAYDDKLFGNKLGIFNLTDSPILKTTDKGKLVLGVYSFEMTSGDWIEITDIQLEQGTTVTPCEHYEEFENKIIAKSCGKNLCDVNSYKKTFVKSNVGQQVGSIIANNIPVRPNTPYTISFSDITTGLKSNSIIIITTEKKEASTTHSHSYSKKIREIYVKDGQTITTGPNENYITITTGNYITDDNTKNFSISNLQLEQSAVKTTYEPYKEIRTVRGIGKNLFDGTFTNNVVPVNGEYTFTKEWSKSTLPYIDFTKDSISIAFKIRADEDIVTETDINMIRLDYKSGEVANGLLDKGFKITQQYQTVVINNYKPNKKDEILQLNVRNTPIKKIYIKDILICKNCTIPESYEFYNEFPVIPNKQDYSKITVKSHSKNLFDGKLEVGNISGGVGPGTDIGGTFARLRGAIYIDKTFTISLNDKKYIFEKIIMVDNDKNKSSSLEEMVVNMPKATINPKNNKYLRFCIKKIDNTPIIESELLSIEKTIQLEKGVEATTYEPCESYEREILLPFSNGLKSSGSVHDEIDLKNGIITQRFSENPYTLDSNVEWFYGRPESGWTENSDYVAFYTYKDQLNTLKKQCGASICGKLKTTTGWSIVLDSSSEVFSLATSNYIAVRVNKNKLTTPDAKGFIKWLKENPISVYYEMKEPIIHKIAINNDNILSIKDSITNAVIEDAILKPSNKNILDTSNLIDGYIGVGGFNHDTRGYISINKLTDDKKNRNYHVILPVNASETYTYSISDKEFTRISFLKDKTIKNNTYINQIGDGALLDQKEYTFTVPEGCNFVSISTTFYKDLNCQLERGPLATSYEHYISNKVSIEKHGKNIFDGVMESGAWDNQGNILGLEDYVRSNEFVSVKPQHIYTLSSNLNGNGRITFFTFDKNPISQIIVNKDSFLCPINAYFIKFDIYKENVSATDVTWVQLEENVKATSYEPYRETITELTLPKKCEDIFGFDKIKDWTKIESTDIDYKEIEVTNDPLTVGRKNLLKNFKTIKGTTSLINGDNILAPISLSVKMDIGKIVLDNQKKLDDIIKIINNGLVGTVSDNAMAINLLSKGFIKRNS